MQRLAFFFLAPVLIATLATTATLPARPADGTYVYAISGVSGLTQSTVVIRHSGDVVSTIETIDLAGDHVIAETDYNASTLLPTHYRLRQHGQTLDVVFANGAARLVAPPKTYLPIAGTADMAVGDGLVAYRIMMPAILAARAGIPISIFSINGGVVTTVSSAAMVVGGIAFRQTSYTTATVAQTPPPAAPIATPVPIASARYVDRTVSFTSSGAILAGTLSIPQSGARRHPAFIFVHGSGPGTRDGAVPQNPTFLDLGNALANAGYAVLRYDKRGIAASTGTFSESWKPLSDDARAAVAFLRTQPDVDPRRIFLLGHSEGGVIVPLIAPSIRPALAGIVMMAGPAISMSHILDEQLAGAAPSIRASFDATFRDYDGLEPAVYITKVDVPILVLQGTRDVQVLAKDLPPMVVAGYKANRKLTVALLNGDDHLFLHVPASQPADGSEYFVPAPLDPRVARTILEWAAAIP